PARRASDLTDHLTGEWVALPEIRNPISAEDARDRASGNTQFWPDPVLATTLIVTTDQHAFFHRGRGLARAMMGPAGAVDKGRLAVLVKTFDPTMRALSGDPLRFGGMSNSPAISSDALDQQLPASEVQTGITVGHEDLRMVGDLDITHRTRRSSLRQHPARSFANLQAEYT